MLTIEKSDNFGVETNDELPDYGMYLKTKSSYNFETTRLSLDNNKTLNIYYKNGVAGQYVVVHAFKKDSLTNKVKSYVAAQEIDKTTASGKTGIRVLDWTDDDNTTITTLEDYTVKVWMEDASNGSSLAQATEPMTFYGQISKIDNSRTGEKNPRVFAMK